MGDHTGGRGRAFCGLLVDDCQRRDFDLERDVQQQMGAWVITPSARQAPSAGALGVVRRS